MDYICFFSLAKCCKNCQLGAQNETKITKKCSVLTELFQKCDNDAMLEYFTCA